MCECVLESVFQAKIDTDAYDLRSIEVTSNENKVNSFLFNKSR